MAGLEDLEGTAVRVASAGEVAFHRVRVGEADVGVGRLLGGTEMRLGHAHGALGGGRGLDAAIEPAVTDRETVEREQQVARARGRRRLVDRDGALELPAARCASPMIEWAPASAIRLRPATDDAGPDERSRIASASANRSLAAR